MSNLNKNTIYQINSISKQLHSFDAIHKSILNPISESLSSIKSLTSSAEYITSSPSLKLKTASDLIESFHSLSSIAASNFRPFSEALDSFRSFNSFANIQSSIATLNLNPVSETLDSLRSINSFANIQSSIAALNLNPISEALDSLNSINSIANSFASVYEKTFNPMSESLNYIKLINSLNSTIPNIKNSNSYMSKLELTNLNESFSTISKSAITKLKQINIASSKNINNYLYNLSDKLTMNIANLQEIESIELDDSDFSIVHKSLNSIYDSLNYIDFDEIDIESCKYEVNTLNKCLNPSTSDKANFHTWITTICAIIGLLLALLSYLKTTDYSQIVNPIKSIDSHITDKMDTIIQNQLESQKSIDEANTKLDKILENK